MRNLLRRILWLLQPRPRNVIAWIGALGLACTLTVLAWTLPGYNSCDFGCQWLQGAMIYYQQGHNLYLVGPQRDVLTMGYSGEDLKQVDKYILLKPRASEYAKPGEIDPADRFGAEKKATGKEPEVEGPLYPPTVALLMWPFAVLDPKAAHAVLTVIYVQLAFVSAWLIRWITNGKLRMGEAALLIFLFPNVKDALVLGQNSLLTLTIVTAGYALWAKKWPLMGGIVWGLLAYKPVFALALIWVPVVLFSWRMFAGMCLSGATFCLLTLPFGLPPERQGLFRWEESQDRWVWALDATAVTQALQPWRRWLEVGANAAEVYAVDENWVWMSRDLVGLPRRQMWDWEHFQKHLRNTIGDPAVSDGEAWRELRRVHTGPAPTLIGWVLMAAVGGGTFFLSVATTLARRRRGEPPWPEPDGPRLAFVLYGGLLTCYHIMHYDMLPLALPTALWLASMDRMSPRIRLYSIVLGVVLLQCTLQFMVGIGWLRMPMEVFVVLVAWAMCGLLTLVDADPASSPAVAGPQNTPDPALAHTPGNSPEAKEP